MVDSSQDSLSPVMLHGDDPRDPPPGTLNGPQGQPPVTFLGASGDPEVDSLMSTRKWGGAVGSGITLTYSFTNTSSSYVAGYHEPTNNFHELTAAQRFAARETLTYWSQIANVTFTEVADNAAGYGDIRFGRTNDAGTAFAYYPNADQRGGDIWLGNSGHSDTRSYPQGSYYYHTFVHEIGHALGLSHPHEGITPLAPAQDWLGTSVMSYRSYPSDPTSGAYSNSFYPARPMLNDIEAIQYLYGANTSFHAGTDVYAWASGQRIFETIYDAGGSDTIDWSNQTTAAVINLNPGGWSQLGPGYTSSELAAPILTTLAIARNTTIENANGGSADDVITGNSVANVLSGNGGNDRLNGGAGADTLGGGGGNDVFSGTAIELNGDTLTDFVSGDAILVTDRSFTAARVSVSGATTINIDSNNDGVTDVVLLSTVAVSGVASTVAVGGGTLLTFGGTGAVINGTAGNDTLTGTVTAQRINGLGGDDILNGRGGDDVLDGGTGTDTATFATLTTSGVTADLLTGVATSADGRDTLIAIENVIGSFTGDVLIGDGNANRLSGAGGNDSLSGGLGDDILDGGTGIDTASFASVAGSGVTANLATGVATSNNGRDTLIAVENVIGTGTGDVLIGNGGANLLNAAVGNDILTGGGGKDTLTGAAGNDKFLFNLASDSGLGAAARDVITDFTHGTTATTGDKINVSAIDANAGVAGNQAFVWKGAGALTGAAQAHYATIGGVKLIQFSTDADAAAEFEIQIPTGFTPVGTGAGSDLIL